MENESRTDRALAHFRKGPIRYNCGQSVLYAFQPDGLTGPTDIEDCKACGSGRLPSGHCGAAWVARQLSPTPEMADAMEAEFVEAAGSSKCKEILALKRLSCEGCVRTAVNLIERYRQLT